jgi:ABC-2 type transport system ATP-binding protein
MVLAMTSVLEINGLRKTYRSRGGPRRALDGFDMHVEAGQVHGFLGPNGSGKTTTLRTLLGLIRADAGEMRILGQPIPEALPQVVAHVGAIVESPQFFGNFSARDTLSLLCDAGNLPQNRVDWAFELVGLRERAQDKVKTYSLGMKQRLAVASALLKQPKLLILDEPANGLDPGGIREMREMMATLSAGGMTVVLSSHILSEIEIICDNVTIISLGRRVASGPVSEVLAAYSTGQVKVGFEAQTDLTAAAQVFTGAGISFQQSNGHLVVSGVDKPATISRLLAERQLYVSELTPIGVDLESVFLELTGTAPVPGQHRSVDDSVKVEGSQS